MGRRVKAAGPRDSAPPGASFDLLFAVLGFAIRRLAIRGLASCRACRLTLHHRLMIAMLHHLALHLPLHGSLAHIAMPHGTASHAAITMFHHLARSAHGTLAHLLLNLRRSGEPTSEIH